MAGERFRINSGPGVRVTISTLAPDEASGIADVLAGDRARRPAAAAVY